MPSDIIITTGYGDCETCGPHDWHTVECPNLNYRSYYSGHFGDGLSIEDSLIQILEQSGYKITRKDNNE